MTDFLKSLNNAMYHFVIENKLSSTAEKSESDSSDDEEPVKKTSSKKVTM